MQFSEPPFYSSRPLLSSRVLKKTAILANRSIWTLIPVLVPKSPRGDVREDVQTHNPIARGVASGSTLSDCLQHPRHARIAEPYTEERPAVRVLLDTPGSNNNLVTTTELPASLKWNGIPRRTTWLDLCPVKPKLCKDNIGAIIVQDHKSHTWACATTNPDGPLAKFC
ncbi:hypothetical protein TPAR_08388 [Tolypocladium paradoxum]|uniref:Uncharacterized protein n=1 Tax=Tolypocladium paradoxum TaxID=94208 RepID=A0A2S4KMK7_9HYPO|nr:hypothetical protein TPAR_08388 [Tolypocladium paradoxum]